MRIQCEQYQYTDGNKGEEKSYCFPGKNDSWFRNWKFAILVLVFALTSLVTWSISALELYLGEGNGTRLQYSCLEKSHGWRSLVDCSPWSREESDKTEQLHFHFSLSCTGEGNGNPLQCSCLENPRGSRAWWAAICGVAQSQTRLKQLSSSSKKVLGTFE